MTTAYTSLLGLALPVTGELQGTWGDTVNNSITSLLDTAVAGTTTLSTDGDVTLSTTTGAANQARQAILLCSGARTALRTITAPAQSKIYTVINATTGGYSVKVVGAGPTTGVTIVAGESALIAWNGSDFIKISNTGGSASFTNVTVSGTTTLSGLTASTALALDASKNVVSVTNTGSGNNVLATSPTLVTPVLGTPTSGTLTNCTGLPVSTGISGLGTNVATFLATPSSANLAAAVTDETGSGSLVFATSPTLVTPTLGVASATSINKVTITAPATGSTLTIADGKTLTANNSLTLAGTDSTTMTFPAASTTVAGLGTTQTFTGINTLTPAARTSGAASYFTLTTPADTGQTASTESIGAYFTAATRTWAAGALTLQRERVFAAPTYAFAGASTLTTAVNVDIATPVAGSNATITNAYALRAGASYFTSTVAVDGNVTVSGGTANGVAYLNASNVLTTGSALVFNGTALGIGVANPNQTLSVQATSTGSSVTVASFANAGLTAGSTVRINFFTGDDGTAGRTRALLEAYAPAANDGALAFYTRAAGSTTQKMLLDASGNLGIGTSSPGAKLDVVGNTTFQGDVNITSATPSLLFSVPSGGLDSRIYNDGSGNFIFGNGTNSATPTERMRLDSSGNLGLGVTPSASSIPVIQSTYGIISGNSETHSAKNAYFNAGWKYTTTSTAARFAVGEGGGNDFRWYTAASGTAGNAISFTQAMTLDASGHLGVGTTSVRDVAVFSGAPLSVGGSTTGNLVDVINASTAYNSSPTAGISFWTKYNTAGDTYPMGYIAAGKENTTDGNLSGYLSFHTLVNGGSWSEKMRLDSSGNLGIGTTSPSSYGILALQGGATASVVARRAALGTTGSPAETALIALGGSSSGTYAGIFALNSWSTDNANWLTFKTGDSSTGTPTERMRLDASGNLGIGTSSPAQLLDVQSASSPTIRISNSKEWTSSDSGVIAAYQFYTKDASSPNGTKIAAYINSENYAGSSVPEGILTFGTSAGSGSSTNATEKMRLDSSGNLGLGVTPSAWLSTQKAIDISSYGAVAASSNGAIRVVQNAYLNSAGNWIYKNTAAAAFYEQDAGIHAWKTAASGTAGNTISFTQAMTLDASGNLGIGSTTAYGRLDVLASAGNNSLHLAPASNTDTGGYLNSTGNAELMLSAGANYNSYSSPNFVMNAKATAAGGIYIAGSTIKFWTNSSLTAGTTFNQTEQMRIDSSGNVLVTGAGGLGYGTGSGGAVTQATSRTTGVTLNKTNGAITLVSAAGTTTWQTFTVTNSTVAATDTIIVNQKSGTDLYQIFVTNVAAGSFKISFATTGGTTTEQPVFNFSVIKAVVS